MKGRFSFVGKKHTMKIDPDIWTHTQQYVKDQMGIMARHGSAPNPPLTSEEWDDLAYEIAKTPQTIRNLNAQLERQKAREARRAGTVSTTP